TYIDNAAEAHVLAADRLRPGAACAGRAYFISQGNPVALWPWLGEILSATGTRSVRRSMGYRRAYSIAAVMELAYRVLRLGGEPPLTRFVVTQLAKSHYFNIEAAERDLGYVPRVSSAEGVARLLTSLEV
ncbi:MAG: 3-beta hydroxysteroid dehydrogenase, partial [bacterium]|nr:3-beta hydroxysteroid dehydrogenase [bacterium]